MAGGCVGGIDRGGCLNCEALAGAAVGLGERAEVRHGGPVAAAMGVALLGGDERVSTARAERARG